MHSFQPPLNHQKQDLPDDVKAAHEHAPSRYNVGWSHGKEALRSGLLDTHKGSYYGNPLQDTYTVDQDTAERYKAYYSPNIWPQVKAWVCCLGRVRRGGGS